MPADEMLMFSLFCGYAKGKKYLLLVITWLLYHRENSMASIYTWHNSSLA